MQIKLKTPLSFIKKENLIEFYLEYRNGAWVVVTSTFSQTIKQSEYEKIIAAVSNHELENVMDNHEDKVIDDDNNIEEQIKEQEAETTKKSKGRPRNK